MNRSPARKGRDMAIHFFDRAKGYSVAAPVSLLAFDDQDGSTIALALNLAGINELLAASLRQRCQRVLMIQHPKTKSIFTRSKLKDNIRRIVDLCDEVGAGVIAWE